MRALIKAGADVNKAIDNGWTPLFVGACLGHETVVLELIESGADVSMAMDNGVTLLRIAAYALFQ